jgi:hypothetical protein
MVSSSSIRGSSGDNRLIVMGHRRTDVSNRIAFAAGLPFAVIIAALKLPNPESAVVVTNIACAQDGTAPKVAAITNIPKKVKNVLKVLIFTMFPSPSLKYHFGKAA